MMASVRGAAFSMLTALLHGDGRTAGTFPPATRWLDLFAGTGAVGLEALSRGCAHATFVELDPWVVEHCLRRNLAHTRYLGAGRPAAAAAAGARAGAGGAPGGAAAAAGGGALRPGRAAGCADVRVADVMVYLGAPPSAGVGGAGGGGQAGAGAPFDVVSVCPPYDKVSYPALLAALDASPLVAPGALLVVEYPRREAGVSVCAAGPSLFVSTSSYRVP